MKRWPEFEDLLGQTIIRIDTDEDKERMTFTLADGRRARLYHSQDCCESVQLEEVIGDLADVIGSPLLIAEVTTNSDDPPNGYSESHTWSFYKMATVKGHVTLRWLGESNGYYCETVSFDLEEAA